MTEDNIEIPEGLAVEITSDDVIDAPDGDDIEVGMKLNIEPEDQVSLRRLGDRPYLLVEIDASEEGVNVVAVAGGRMFGLEGVRDLTGLLHNFLTNGVVEEQPLVPVAEWG